MTTIHYNNRTWLFVRAYHKDGIAMAVLQHGHNTVRIPLSWIV